MLWCNPLVASGTQTNWFPHVCIIYSWFPVDKWPHSGQWEGCGNQMKAIHLAPDTWKQCSESTLHKSNDFMWLQQVKLSRCKKNNRRVKHLPEGLQCRWKEQSYWEWNKYQQSDVSCFMHALIICLVVSLPVFVIFLWLAAPPQLVSPVPCYSASLVYCLVKFAELVSHVSRLPPWTSVILHM